MSRSTVQYCVQQLRNCLLIMLFLTVLIAYREYKYNVAMFSTLIPKDAMKFLEFKTNESYPSDLVDLRHLIEERNREQTILNKDTFGSIKADTVIFVIHVKKLTKSLKYMVASLTEVRGIETVLLIFSHSSYDENFNEFVRLIDFCRVMQLFFPHSVQANPDNFPGFDKNDCSNDIDKDKAGRLNCTGTPDVNGKYRQAAMVENKHHWWWTANKIFEDLRFSDSYDGTVVFLDDDLYLLQDFLFMVIYMKDAADSKNGRNEFLSLGSSDLKFTRNKPQEEMFYGVTVSTWNPKYYSSALAFDSSGWNRIVTHYDLFCSVDDYSWSRSLFQISLNMKDNSDRIMVMYPEAPRAYKLGKDESATMNDLEFQKVAAVLGMQAAAKNYLFPAIIEIYTEIVLPNAELDDLFQTEVQGGWSDPRDKMLCSNITVRKIKKELFETAVEFKQQHLVI